MLLRPGMNIGQQLAPAAAHAPISARALAILGVRPSDGRQRRELGPARCRIVPEIRAVVWVGARGLWWA